MRTRMIMRKRWLTTIPILVVVIASLFLIQLPYFTMSPGAALELSPIVQVQGGYRDEKGKLMMTTVRTDRATLFSYLYAQLSPTTDLVPLQQILSPNEDVNQYFKRQEAVMKDSQQTAIIVAFQKANVPIQVINKGAVVTEIIPGMPAEKLLKAGDVITAVDGEKVENAEELISALRGRSKGEKVELSLLREGSPMTITIPLAPFPTEWQIKGEGQKVGIGIYSPATEREVIPSKKVNFKTEHIGGPSAGLMFTLELINQLTPGDLTKGYAIAGTGTISMDGTVGPIGGIQHKVVGAKRKGAAIFFAPDNPPLPGERSNYEDAVEANKRLNLGLKIIPVKKLDDALNYLSSLPPNGER
ncbi:SepM family pheromone-processing serine protease [Thermicanus aegyptius]|uniref:SepM family pheromone-processing serine protease n=1 Tax=Thermicanus aegyptius TaxID=94009 RepID=UPI000A059E46|nr:SepM family pheromone-processing serine protease [Thermicanus aegyptius]